MSDHRHELALGIGVAVNVPLGGLDRPMTGQQLNIAQRATGLVNEPSGTGDECPTAGMGRTALQANVLERPVEPDDNTEWCQWAAALRRNHKL